MPSLCFPDLLAFVLWFVLWGAPAPWLPLERVEPEESVAAKDRLAWKAKNNPAVIGKFFKVFLR